MAKKKKRKKKKKDKMEIPSLFGDLKDETKHGIAAVLFFVFAVFFILSAFSVAGVAGDWIYKFFYGFFGVGYYLIPILFMMIAITYTGSLQEHIGALRMFGSTLFFISALALIDLVFDAGGGLVGAKLSGPLQTFFGNATVIILIALVLISVLILFDLRFSFEPLKRIGGLFSRKKKDEYSDDYDDGELYDDYDDAEEEIEEEEHEDDEEYEEEEEPKKKKGLKIFGNKSDDEVEEDGGFRILPTSNEYVPPPLKLLDKTKGKPDVGDIKASANLIKRTFSNFGIDVEMDEVSIGPTVTRYALKPAEGVRLQKIVGLQNNLELALAASPVRIEAPIPGKALVGIEVPNSAVAKIGMLSLLNDKRYQNSEVPLWIALGKNVEGVPTYHDLSKMPHCLIAGTTGSGKSVTMHSIINSLLFRNGPEQLRLMLVDPKRVELTLYDGLPHLLAPVITDAKKTILALNWAAKEMNRRYDVLKEHHVRDIDSYHKNILAPAKEEQADGGIENEDMPEAMPFIVIMIDELADIMLAYPRELEASIVRIAQMSRAVGIHLIISTQRPSVNIITGLIKANIPSRIALSVASGIDSKTILDQTGAQNLIGKGDMLFMSGEMAKPKRIQSPFISEGEVKKIVKYLRKSHADDVPNIVNFTEQEGNDPVFGGNLGEDDNGDVLYGQARIEVIRAGKASTSYLQRKLRVGYSRAARLMDLLEEHGVIGPADGSKARSIIDDGTGRIEVESDDNVILNPLDDEDDEKELEEAEEDDEETEEEEDSEEEDEEHEEELEEEEDDEEDDSKDLYSTR